MIDYPFYLNAESVTVDSDEGRTVLEITDAESGKRLTVNIHDCDLDAFYDSVKARIGPYLRERDEAARAHGAAKRAQFDAFYCDPDESAGAYDLSDPKHPNFHSIHADIWDARAGK